MQIPFWFKIKKPEFEELTRDIYNNEDNKDFKITINKKKTYDLKNAKKIWTKVTTSKTSRNEAKKLYNGLIQKDTDALKREKSSSINKYNISKIFDNINAIFTGAYFRCKDVPKKTIVGRSIVKRVKL